MPLPLPFAWGFFLSFVGNALYLCLWEYHHCLFSYSPRPCHEIFVLYCTYVVDYKHENELVSIDFFYLKNYFMVFLTFKWLPY